MSHPLIQKTMKKLYVTLLSLISFSLAGMEQPDHSITATVEPVGKYYSKESNTEKKFIRVKAVQFIDTQENEIVFPNNLRYHSALQTYVPKQAPLTIFTENESYIETRTDNKSKPNIIYEFTLKAHKQYSEKCLSDNS